MSKRIYKQDYHEGLILCERNGLEFYRRSRESLNMRAWRSAFLFAVISFEEIVKAYMILDSYDCDCISGNKWEDKMKQHEPKLKYGANMIDSMLKGEISKLLDRGVSPKNIMTEINPNYVEDFVKKVKNDRLQYVYVDYDHENNKWIPVKNEFKVNDVREVLDASASLWHMLHERIREMGITTIPIEEYQSYFL